MVAAEDTSGTSRRFEGNPIARPSRERVRWDGQAREMTRTGIGF